MPSLMPIRVAAWMMRHTRDFPGRWRLALWTLNQVKAAGASLGTRTIRTHDGTKLECDLRDWVPAHLYATGEWEGTTTRVAKALLKPGMTAIDVGAHIGVYTLLFSKLVGREGQVFAFEPNPGTVQRLGRNLRLNSAVNVTVKEAVAGATPGNVCFYLGAAGHTSLSSVTPNGTSPVSVARLVLDDVVPGPVSLLKIDAEGAEAEVLAGAQRLLAQGLPHVLAEVNASDWPSELLAAGYRIWRLNWQSITPVDDPSDPSLPTQYNALFTRYDLPPELDSLISREAA